MDLKTQAELLTKDSRRQIIMDYKETNLHKALKEFRTYAILTIIEGFSISRRI